MFCEYLIKSLHENEDGKESEPHKALPYLWFGMVVCNVVNAALESYLNWRHMNFLLQLDVTPSPTYGVSAPEIFEASKERGIRRQKFLIVRKVIQSVLDILKLCFGYYHSMWYVGIFLMRQVFWNIQSELYVSPFYVFALNLFALLEDLPFAYYEVHVLNEMYEDNCKKWKFWMKHLANALYCQLFMIPKIGAMVGLIMMQPNCLCLWLGILSMVPALLFRVRIPKACKDILPESALRNEIIKLCDKVNFPRKEFYIVRNLEHDNLAPVQILESEDLILHDSIFLDKVEKNETRLHVDINEILAVVCQIFSKRMKRHDLKLYVLQQIKVFFLFFVYAYIYKSECVGEALGFPNGFCPLTAGFIVIYRYLCAPLLTVEEFLINKLKQKYARQADAFVYCSKYGWALASALVRLSVSPEKTPFWDCLNMTSYRNDSLIVERCDYIFGGNNDTQKKNGEKTNLSGEIPLEDKTDNSRSESVRTSRKVRVLVPSPSRTGSQYANNNNSKPTMIYAVEKEEIKETSLYHDTPKHRQSHLKYTTFIGGQKEK